MTYNANGQLILTSVPGTSYTGLYAADGSFNAVLTTENTTWKGLHHPCGAYWGTVVSSPSSPVSYYAKDGSMNITQNSDSSYSTFFPQPTASQAPYLQAVASGGLPLASQSGAQNGGYRSVSLSKHYFGPSDVTQMQIGDTDLVGLSFAASGFNATVARTIYIPGAPTPLVRCKFSGNLTGALNSGTVLLLCDPVLPSQFGLSKFTHNTAFYTYGQYDWLASAIQFAYNSIGAGGSTNYSGTQMTPLANFVDHMSDSGTSLVSHFCRLPVVIIGAPVTPHVSVFAHGDSLIQSYNPDNGDNVLDNGPGGWFLRGLANVNGSQLPWTNLGIDGNSSATIIGSATALALIAALVPYFTHFICDFGHNGLTTAAAEMARMTTIWNLLKTTPGSKIRHIEHCAMLPQTVATFPITSITSVGTLCTVTAPGAQYLTNGTNVQVSGATPAAYNTNAVISNVVSAGAASTYQYTAASAPGTAATGTIVGNDFWQSQGNQTPNASFAPNGTSFKDTFNAALAAAVGGGLLDGVLTHSSVEPTLGFWKTNGTDFGYTSSGPQPDGTHPNTNGHQLMGPEFNTRAATWT
jgi:lysophospholipase L1-like esterase